MAVRRSARIRSHSSEPQPQSDTVDHNKANAHQSNDKDNNNNNNNQKLPPVMERDEPQPNATQGTKTMRTPVRNSISNSKTPEKKSTENKTPTSIAAARPPMGEMHPSKVHQSTTKQADSGLILGFNPVKKDANGNVVKDSVVQNTPTKARTSPSSQYGTPGFEFKFACQESELSDEAKRLMESVRGDVSRIRSQLVQENKDKPADETRDGGDQRKIARPKGMASRFSNAHMAQFKKMDSIADHPSAFRATPGRFQPVVEATGGKTLKRTKSNARLDESECRNTSPSKPSPAPAPAPAVSSAKRVKHDKKDDASSRRPASGEDSQAASAPTPAPTTTSRRVTQKPRARSTVRSSLMTPTKASMARTTAASVKPPKKPSMIPAPTQSPAAKTTMVTPRTPQTEFNPRLKTSLPSFANLKSILRRREPLFSKDPAKIAAGTHSAAPDFTPDLLLGDSNGQDDAQTPSPKKRVGFSPSAKSPHQLPPASPSPSKIPTTASAPPASDVAYPTLPTLTPEDARSKHATIRHIRPSDADEEQPEVPEVPGVMHGINNKKRHRVEPEQEADTENVPPADATPTGERSTKRVKLGTPIKFQQPPTPTPVKGRVGSNTPLRAGRGNTTGTPASVRKSRGFLSSSRLNMLAQPKQR